LDFQRVQERGALVSFWRRFDGSESASFGKIPFQVAILARKIAQNRRFCAGNTRYQRKKTLKSRMHAASCGRGGAGDGERGVGFRPTACWKKHV